jgi:hypothetical protein
MKGLGELRVITLGAAVDVELDDGGDRLQVLDRGAVVRTLGSPRRLVVT